LRGRPLPIPSINFLRPIRYEKRGEGGKIRKGKRDAHLPLLRSTRAGQREGREREESWKAGERGRRATFPNKKKRRRKINPKEEERTYPPCLLDLRKVEGEGERKKGEREALKKRKGEAAFVSFLCCKPLPKSVVKGREGEKGEELREDKGRAASTSVRLQWR